MSKSTKNPYPLAFNSPLVLKAPTKDLSLSELIKGVTHELNNNIAVALGQVQLLKLKNKNEEITDGLNRIEKTMFKCDNLIKSVQSYVGQPIQELQETVDLADALTASLQYDETSWREDAVSKNITVILQLVENDNGIYAKFDDSVTAISHLLHNAIDASKFNGIIEITCSTQNELVSMSVADRGRGISEDTKHKIYEPFYTTKKTKGSGLGLTIVQSIATRYGGRVGFSPNKPAGTVFTMSFPASDSDIMAVSKNENRAHEKRILIVDDDEEVRNVLSDMLSIEGLNAECCPDAYTAMEILEKGTFNLIITDLGMPGMSGYDLAEYVRDKYKDIEIVLLTGWGETLRKDRKKLKGIKAIISKPFRLKQVLELARN